MKELNDLSFDLLPLSFLLAAGPAAAWFFYSSFAQRPILFASFLTFVISTLIGTAAGCLSLSRKSWQVRHLGLGLAAERATGEELNQLMRDGFYVFHDFQADRFNIDHALIGPTGEYAVETKSRWKPVGFLPEVSRRVTIIGFRFTCTARVASSLPPRHGIR